MAVAVDVLAAVSVFCAHQIIVVHGAVCFHVRGCVYAVICQCGDSHIDETGRPLVSSNLPSYMDEPFAKLRAEKHSDSIPDLKICVLGLSHNKYVRKGRGRRSIGLEEPFRRDQRP